MQSVDESRYATHIDINTLKRERTQTVRSKRRWAASDRLELKRQARTEGKLPLWGHGKVARAHVLDRYEQAAIDGDRDYQRVMRKQYALYPKLLEGFAASDYCVLQLQHPLIMEGRTR